MDLLIRMRIIYNLQHRFEIYLEIGDKFLTFLTNSVTEAKASTYPTIK